MWAGLDGRPRRTGRRFGRGNGSRGWRRAQTPRGFVGAEVIRYLLLEILEYGERDVPFLSERRYADERVLGA